MTGLLLAEESPPQTAHSWVGRLIRFAAIVLTCGIIIAHGCHGPDEDHEPGVEHLR